MYLKEVEVNGFKSFADKISFKFNEGITAIVGPNGSGKSNVVDAVRWVLGEQSVKQLRGERMEDVIFAGTVHRKSQGYAYVSLTIDNKDKLLKVDYEEIKVSRKLYRSGDSEYRINDNLCRLKDIHEIFYDTGIGKDGYSIIGQGEIDKILSGKSDKRRELIDEAIGIVKFKKRKQETLKKLDGQEVNLVRILDILQEMQNQLKPLEIQAKKAKDYLVYKDTLKSYEVYDFVKTYKAFKDKLEKLEQDILNNKASLSKLEEERELSRNSHTKVDEEFKSLQEQITTINDDIKEKLGQMSELGSNEKLLEQEVEFLSRNISTLDMKVEVLEEQIRIQEASYEENEAKIKELNELRAKKEEQVEPRKNELANLTQKVTTDSHSLAKDRLELEKILEKEKYLSNEHSYNKAICEQFATKKLDLEENKVEVEKDIEFIEGEYSKEEVRLSTKRELERELTTKKDELRTGLENIGNDISTDRKRIIEQEARLSKSISKLNLLENMATRYEGYGQAIKRIMESYSTNEKNLGVVADLINVDKDYEVAIETALGGSLQNIVTKDTSCAKEMIATLRKNRWGRATFLPLDSLKVRRTLVGDKILAKEGIVDVAVNLVSLPQGFEVLGNYLLATTLVAKDIDSAIEINKSTSGYRIVTLAGELLMPTGSMSGGSFKNSFNLLSRSREIEELRLEISKLNKVVEEIKLSLDSNLKEQKAIEDYLNSVYDEREVLRLEIAKDSENLINLKNLLSKKKAELSTLTNLFENHIGSFKASSEQLDDFSERLVETISAKEELLEEIDSCDKLVTENLEKIEKEKLEISRLEADLVSNEQLLDFCIETKTRLNVTKLEKIDELEKSKSSISLSKQDVEEKKSTILRYEKEYEVLKKDHSGLIEQARQLELRNKELSENNKHIFNEREKLNEEILSVEKEKLRLESIYEGTEEKFSSRVDYIFDEYSLTYSEAKKLNRADYKEIDVKLEIDGLKKKIRAMGSINVNAVEEYRNLKERHDFLEKQKNDILLSKDKLLEVITSLDEGMIEQFNAKFGLLQTSFTDIFVKLFGGGRVGIELTEPDNILESGIEINAQPPGKKLQNMLQLSGGEKALTAISLMFAIQSLNPSPFCFLDEIEAALDDTNVVRFSSYLSKLTTNTQFIVITHRKGTMQSADRLYGVTMQEKGVSTLVSVEMVGI